MPIVDSERPVQARIGHHGKWRPLFSLGSPLRNSRPLEARHHSALTELDPLSYGRSGRESCPIAHAMPDKLTTTRDVTAARASPAYRLRSSSGRDGLGVHGKRLLDYLAVSDDERVSAQGHAALDAPDDIPKAVGVFAAFQLEVVARAGG
jgi:hypothetical protein